MEDVIACVKVAPIICMLCIDVCHKRGCTSVKLTMLGKAVRELHQYLLPSNCAFAGSKGTNRI